MTEVGKTLRQWVVSYVDKYGVKKTATTWAETPQRAESQVRMDRPGATNITVEYTR